MCEKKTITLRNADSSLRRKMGALREVQTREKHAIQYCMQWEHWGRFWQEIMRNGEQPLMSKRVKNTRYNTARSGSTEGVGALREVLGGNYEERRAAANASYLRAL
ncbi:hypothetical protein B0H11DRAFT_1933637 [Mycena galericulata]|nr:hypothetical protein B0H11DRAFT_1933637 [Mycena galericulata]